MTVLNFAFQNRDYTIRALRDVPLGSVQSDAWWFVGNDVCAALGLTSNPRMALARLDGAMKGVRHVYTLGGHQRLTVVSEPGVHVLAMTSRSQAASELRVWIAGCIAAPRELRLDSEFRTVRRGLRVVPLTDLEFRLVDTLHGRTRQAYADWLAEVVGVTAGALHGLTHRVRKKLEPLDYGIVNVRAGAGESGAYVLSDLAA